MNELMNECMETHLDYCYDGWMDGPRNGGPIKSQMGKCINGWIDGYING